MSWSQKDRIKDPLGAADRSRRLTISRRVEPCTEFAGQHHEEKGRVYLRRSFTIVADSGCETVCIESRIFLCRIDPT